VTKYVTYIKFASLPHVKDVDVVPSIEPFLQFFHLDFVSSHFGWRLLAANSAEFLIIDQLADCRILPARRAIRIFAQLELTKLHRQRVDQQQPPDQRIPRTQNELNRLRCLNY